MGKMVLVAVIGVMLVSEVVGNWSALREKYDVEYWQDVFLDSQVTRGGKARNVLSDYDLYAIVGYKYLHGDSPMNLHPEVPPLGKQIIGLGILLFGNQNLINFYIGLACLGLVYLLGRQLFGQSAPALASVLVLAVNGEFRHLLSSSNLDIPQLFFLLLSVAAFVKGIKVRYWFWLSSFSLGLMMATKFYFNGLILMGVYILCLLILRRFEVFIRYIVSLIFVPLGYVLPYIPALIYQPDLIYFLKFQRWMTSWWAGNAGGTWGSIFPLIFTGWWKTWWGETTDYIRVQEWDITWPILTTWGLTGIVKIVRKKDSKMFLIWLWPAVYLAFLAFTTPFPRYTAALFPFWSLLTVYLLTKK